MKPQWPEELSGHVVVLFRRQPHITFRWPRVQPRDHRRIKVAAPFVLEGARPENERRDGKGSDDSGRFYRARGRIEAAPVGGPSADHRAYRGGALSRRPVGERGISRREGRAV